MATQEKKHYALATAENNAAEKQSDEPDYRELYEKARKSEELYRSLLNSSADAIVVYDLEGRTQYISPAFTKIFGWRLEEIQGIRIPFVPEFEKNKTLEVIADLITDGTPCSSFETKRYTKDGRILDISISASRYDDHKGNPAGILVILRDITDKKLTEAKLMQSRRMEAIGTLAGGIAHDFNNLMMGIMGYTTLMLHTISESHPFYNKLKKIEKLINHGSNLTGQLLSYARQGKYKVMPINLNSIITQSTQTFARTKKEIVVNLKLADDLKSVEADRSQIEQVLLNLFIAAAETMPHGGKLDIITHNTSKTEIPPQCSRENAPETEDFVKLTIINSDAAIADETVERIFAPFFSVKNQGRGLGTGVSSALKMISGRQCFINAEPYNGKGTTISLFLPVAQHLPDDTPCLNSLLALNEGLILLVDDEEVVLDVGQKMLNRLGYTVIEASDGKAAIQIYKDRKDKIDLTILDVIMPGIGGSEILEAIKAINPNAKVLLSSGYSMDERIEDIMQRGCHGFIQKPFTLQQLGNEIQKILKP